MNQATMAQLTGLSVSSVRKAGELLAARGFGSVNLHRTPHKMRVTDWKLDRRLWVPDHEREERPYFSFSCRAIYGGNWAELSPVQQAVYLSVGTQVRTYSEYTAEAILADLVDDEVIEHVLGQDRIVMGFVSYQDIVDVTGISRNAVIGAVSDFAATANSMLRIFRSHDGGANLYVMDQRFTPVQDFDG